MSGEDSAYREFSIELRSNRVWYARRLANRMEGAKWIPGLGTSVLSNFAPLSYPPRRITREEREREKKAEGATRRSFIDPEMLGNDTLNDIAEGNTRRIRSVV